MARNSSKLSKRRENLFALYQQCQNFPKKNTSKEGYLFTHGNLPAYAELNNRVRRFFPKSYQSSPIREMVSLLCKHGFSQCPRGDSASCVLAQKSTLFSSDFRAKGLPIFAMTALVSKTNIIIDS